MSIQDVIKNKKVEPATEETKKEEGIAVYTSVKGCCSSKGGLMPKVGEIFLNPCKEDIEILEYFVSVGIVEKTIKTEEVEE